MIETIYEKVIIWAKIEPTVRAIIVEGSRARDSQHVDRYSDYDLNLYVTDVKKLFNDTAWIKRFHPVWAIEKNREPDGIRLCLTLFEGGYDIDFKLIPSRLLQTFVEMDILPDEYHRGYNVVLDKDNLAVNLPKASLTAIAPQKPSCEEFLYVIDVFWFEMFHMIKDIHRKDLWHVKVRDAGIKQRMLQMLEWHARASNKWEYHDTWMLGKRMKSWVDPEKWDGLFNTYGRFDIQDSWKVAMNMMAYFKQLARETASLLSYEYPSGLDDTISNFLCQNPPVK